MHPDYERANSWSKEVIGAAIEVHRLKGPGLLETIYEKCLVRELFLRQVPAAPAEPPRLRGQTDGGRLRPRGRKGGGTFARTHPHLHAAAG